MSWNYKLILQADRSIDLYFISKVKAKDLFETNPDIVV